MEGMESLILNPYIRYYTVYLDIKDLRFNKIKEITKDTFENLPRLNTLLLNNNHLTRIENDSFGGLPDLRYLYLYKNRIKNIQSHAFRGLRKLEQLYIHFNKIERLETDTFTGLQSLERLFLHNNHLSRIPYGAFKQLKSLRRLRLDSNALICDCQLMWLTEMLKEKKGTTQIAATCEQPAGLQGKSIMSLGEDDFSCKMPQLTEEPHDVDVTFGGTAYFNCKADGDPKPDIVWLHNSNEISPEPDSRYNILHDGTLQIVEAQDLDEGVYECMAKNPAGEIKSRAAKMHYYEVKGKLTFIEHPTDHTALVGSTVILPCKASADPVPHITWTHNEDPVPNSQRYHLSSSGTLLIKNAQRSDSGIYQCTATSNESHITVSARLLVQAPPTFLERPRDQEAIEGNDVELICLVEGFPPPRLSWTKDGEPARTRGGPKQSGAILNIKRVQKTDEGIYTCHAENDAGIRNSSALLMVREKVPPVFTNIPEDQRIALGSSVEVPCHAKGQPMPIMSWKKDGNFLSSDDSNHRISPHGVLYMFNVQKDDEGIYECMAQNDVGHAAVSVYLTVGDGPATRRFPGNRYVISALDEARLEVEKALNHTLNQLFGEPHRRTPGELLQVFRFPNDEARNAARSAEIYERALEIVWNRVQTGERFNLTEFSYQRILSPSHLELLANLSGCLVHRQPPPCDDICFHRHYRTLDGSCNNVNNPLWGSSLTPFIRLLPPIYENGFNMPIGWSKSHLYNGFSKPSARLVSSAIVSADSVTKDSEVSHMLMQWGQFLDHDIDFSMPSISHASFVHGVDCAVSCEYAPPCFPIEVPQSDRRIHGHQCMEFVRSSTVCGSGMTSVFFNQVQPREQVNQLTAYIDASNVYGSNNRLSRHLRNFTAGRGLLRSGVLMHTGKPLLPFNDGQPIDCKRDLRDSSIDCFLAGDVRANEQLGLLSMHTLWMREHNRIANDLFIYNPQWNDDKVYHEARKIVGAIMQHITYTHWLPKVLGPKGMQLLGPYTGYQPNVNPTVSNVFATAALRFGHTLINPELLRLNESYQPIPEGNLPLRKAFFAPFRLLEEGGMDPLMRGLIFASAKLKRPDELLNSDLTEHLFTPAHLVAQDLASLNIQRGRDHALPSYNVWRKFCNLTVAHTFEGFSNEITDDSLLRKLEKLYGHPDNIDLWVGGISEDPVEGAKVGPTFLCILVDQFRRLRLGDRHWHENPGVFNPEQLTQIKLSSLGRVLCDSGDNITTITKDVFLIPGVQKPSFIKCSSLPKLEVKVWTECCQGCDASRDPNEISRLHYRTKRSGTNVHKDRVMLDGEPVNFSGSQTERNALENAWHQQEHDFDITEQRIEGLEDLVGKLEQTVKRLSRKVRRLEVEYKLRNDSSCRDNVGRKHKSGEKWYKDKCTTCECENSQVTCHVISCPPVHCQHPKLLDNVCCPAC